MIEEEEVQPVGLWGHGDAGGGQTEHPGGGQVRGWLEGEGGESAIVQDYGDKAMHKTSRGRGGEGVVQRGRGESQPLCRTMGTQRCRRWENKSIQGVGR